MNLKVAVVIDTWFPLVGGGQINAYEISKAIAAKGHAVDIITRDNGKDNLNLPKNLHVYKLGGYKKPYDTISKILFLIKSFKFIYRKDYDIVHVHAFLPGITAMMLGFFKRTPTVFGVHGTSIGTNITNPFKGWLEKLILTKIRYTSQITVSRDFQKLKNVNSKIFYVSNGVDVGVFEKVKTTKFNNPTLIFVGRLHFEKNLENLIKAIFEAKKEIPDIKLLIVGSGPEEKALKNLVKKLHLKKSIIIVGQKRSPDLIKLYKSSSIFILPSIYEGQPLTILEAWASKIPVIASKTGDIQFLVKEGYNGFFINDPNNIYEIANVITGAVNNKNLKQMGENGFNFVKNNFSWKKSATQTLEIYNQILSRKINK